MPGPLALRETCCAPACTEPENIQVPGANGLDGAAGVAGTNGISPVTSVTAQFLMPAEGANVTVAVGNNEGIVVGSKYFVQTAGTMGVISKSGTQSVILQNLENTASGLYTDNAAPTTAIPAGSLMMPTGAQGASGALSGAAGGDLESNYPNPRVAITTTLGDIIVNNNAATAPRNTRLARGADYSVLHTDSAQPTGRRQSGIDLTGVLTLLSGALSFANGGTSATTRQAALNALAALTTRGQLLVRNSSGDVVPLTLGAAGTILGTAAGLDPGYLQITSNFIDPTFPIGQRQTCFVAGQVINLNAAAGSDTLLTIVPPTPTRYIVRRIVLESASVDLSASAARIGVYTNTAKGGTPVLVDPNNELLALTNANIWEDLVLSAVALNTVMTASTLYLHLSAVHGSAATLKLWMFGDNVS